MQMFSPDKLSPFVPLALALVSALFIISAFLLIWKGRLKAAALSGTLFFLSVILAYFPQLDSVSALSISVKLGRQIDQAKELLSQIKSLSEATATASYYSIAWQGRWADENYAKQKKRSLDAVVSEMKLLNVPEERQAQIAAPLIGTIAADLIHVFDSTLTGCSQTTATAQHATQIPPVPTPPDFTQEEIMSGADMQRLFEQRLAQIPPEPRNVEPLRKLAAKLSGLLDASRAAHNYTDETAEFLDQYLTIAESGQFCAKLDGFR